MGVAGDHQCSPQLVVGRNVIVDLGLVAVVYYGRPGRSGSFYRMHYTVYRRLHSSWAGEIIRSFCRAVLVDLAGIVGVAAAAAAAADRVEVLVGTAGTVLDLVRS
jgi:hypothetical protein